MARILVIDDSFLQRRILSGFIRNRGHEVLEAEGGQVGLELLEAGAVDLVLLDLLMPEMSGFDVLGTIRNQGDELPVVIVSADIQEAARARCEELGATAFLNKPVDEGGLFTAVEPLLRKSA